MIVFGWLLNPRSIQARLCATGQVDQRAGSPTCADGGGNGSRRDGRAHRILWPGQTRAPQRSLHLNLGRCRSVRCKERPIRLWGLNVATRVNGDPRVCQSSRRAGHGRTVSRLGQESSLFAVATLTGGSPRSDFYTFSYSCRLLQGIDQPLRNILGPTSFLK